MTFYKIFGFLLETTRFSIVRIQFKLVTKETQKLIATSHVIRLKEGIYWGEGPQGHRIKPLITQHTKQKAHKQE